MLCKVTSKRRAVPPLTAVLAGPSEVNENLSRRVSSAPCGGRCRVVRGRARTELSQLAILETRMAQQVQACSPQKCWNQRARQLYTGHTELGSTVQRPARWPCAGRSASTVPGPGRAPFRFRLHSVLPFRVPPGSSLPDTGVPVRPRRQATESNTADSCAAFAPTFSTIPPVQANDVWYLVPLRMRRLRSKKRSTSPVCMHLARAWARQGGQLERARLLLAGIDRHASPVCWTRSATALSG